MIKINQNFTKLQSTYLFTTIARKVSAFQEANPDREVIKLGIGDVTRALTETTIAGFRNGVEEMAVDESFKGYGPEQGYEFLRRAIAEHDFQSHGADIDPSEVFVSDGAKCDTGNFQELFAQDLLVAVPDPVYPVYVDTNVMAGRTGAWESGRYQGLHYLESTEENAFVPSPPEEKVDLIYLCFPNNPTGATASRQQLAAWVEYARKNKALILFDAAYEAFIRDDSIPHSIYEIDGAKEVAVEFRSYSKTAGFTGSRCAYTVVPKECIVYDEAEGGMSLHTLWNRRQTTKFNGVSYPVQRAAEATYTPAGQRETRERIDYYLENAATIRESTERIGLPTVGGENSPYLWIKTETDSWSFFDNLLEQAAVVCTPGSGFGRCGEGYVRLSAFNSHENVREAMRRIESALS